MAAHELKVTSNSKEIIIEFENTANLSELLIDNNIYVDRPCGGKGTCGKCTVQFASTAPPANSYDEKKLTEKEIKDGYRLSCKCTLDSSAHIIVKEKETMAIQEYGFTGKNQIDYDNDIFKNSYGIAIDLGTTTIVAYLVKLEDGKVIDVKSAINPQREYGDNVITRSEYIHNNEDGLETLKYIALEKINKLINTLCINNKINSAEITRVVLSGNTIMQHIILGVDPYQITLAPFTPVFTEQKILSADKLGLNIYKDAQCYIINSISGYIGGDIVSGIIAAEMDKTDKTTILIDIGTNGEIVLSHNNKMYACSVAAGPAFEGEHIKHGMGGVPGAINKAYSKNGSLVLETINNEKPKGICGSGILDITAYLLNNNIMDEMGTLDETKCQTVDDQLVYNITSHIYISQKDIREVQLAKSAISAGIEVLIQKAEISFSQVDAVYLAGGFGSYLNIESASDIGLINKELKDKCISIGNSAGMGSIKSLLSDKVLKSLDALVDKVQYIELSMDKTFNDLFIDNMMF